MGCATLVMLAACGMGCRSEGDAALEEGAEGVSRTAGKGPVSLTLGVSPARAVFSWETQVVVTIEVLAESGVAVEVDDYELALREGDRPFEYRVVGSKKTLAEPIPGGRLRWSYRYELEFFLPGQYELPPASVSFVDLRDAEAGSGAESAGKADELETEPITIVMAVPQDASLTAEELEKIPTMRPIELPRLWPTWWWLVLVFALALLVAIMLVVRRRRTRRAQRAVVIPAHEWALAQLAALVAEGLIEKGLVQEFYYRISGIVRGYVERRFSVLAPEMTTEEFLTAAATDRRFGEAVTLELERFLTACDLVKYARHEPARAECDAVLEAAGGFVERTRAPEEIREATVTERSSALLHVH